MSREGEADAAGGGGGEEPGRHGGVGGFVGRWRWLREVQVVFGSMVEDAWSCIAPGTG